MHLLVFMSGGLITPAVFWCLLNTLFGFSAGGPIHVHVPIHATATALWFKVF